MFNSDLNIFLNFKCDPNKYKNLAHFIRVMGFKFTMGKGFLGVIVTIYVLCGMSIFYC